MSKTAVADLIIPSVFEKYALERTAELSAFGQCGILAAAPEFDALASAGGREVKMPFWKDLTATRQLLGDAGTLTVNKITADQDVARTRGRTVQPRKSSCCPRNTRKGKVLRIPADSPNR